MLQAAHRGMQFQPLTGHPGQSSASAQAGAVGDAGKGVSVRGAQALVLASKVVALLDGRANVSYEDVDRVLSPALNHRVMLNFEAEAERISPDAIIEDVLKSVPQPTT